jgi:sterol desaturase/sphingolipid hydroxylase (fatty acid hydroxylase superfamily)
MSPKLLILTIVVPSLLVLESYFPFFKFNISTVDRIKHNLCLGVITASVSALLLSAIVTWVSSIIGYPSPNLIATIHVPLLETVLSFIILDCYMYGWHRLMHVFPIAWRFHRVHHTDLYMNVSTAYRFHAIETICSNIPKLLLIWYLGITTQQLLIYESVFTAIVALHHSNLALPPSLDKYLSQAIVTPNYHRIHHSQIIAETNSNYGSVLTCWDRIFGSYVDRQNIEDIELGVKEQAREFNVWELLVLPSGSTK